MIFNIGNKEFEISDDFDKDKEIEFCIYHEEGGYANIFLKKEDLDKILNHIKNILK